MSGGYVVIGIFVTLWIWGWIASILETSVSQEPKIMKKIGGSILLLLIWPYIAFCMFSQGDL